MITKEKCKILKEIQELQKKKKPIPLCLLQKLAKCQPPLFDNCSNLWSLSSISN